MSRSLLLLSLQQSNILIKRRPAQIAGPCQLTDIQLPIAEGRIVAKEHCFKPTPHTKEN